MTSQERKKEYMREYRIKNKEKLAAQVKAYHQAHSEEIKEYRKRYEQTEKFKKIKKECDARYYQKNKEKASEYGKARYKAKCNEIKERVKKWVEDNPEKVLLYKQKYRDSNPERVSSANAKWAKNNQHIRKEHFNNRRMRKSGGKITRERIQHLLKIQKGRCCYCREKFTDGYHVDHIMPLALGGTNTDDNIQLLCPTCNLKKGAKDPIQYRQSQGFLL